LDPVFTSAQRTDTDNQYQVREKKEEEMKTRSQIGALLFSSLLVFIVPIRSFGDGSCIKGNCRNGHGTLALGDGSMYVGEWKDGKKHGHGTLTRPEGSRYVGEWKDNEPHGQGSWFFYDGGRYVGEWKKSEFNGQGTYVYANGATYRGEFINGSPTDKGVWIYPNSGKTDKK
jgi:hypothetical protein